MNLYKPRNKQEVYLFKYYKSKTDISKALKLTRPTVDKICNDPTYFIKYADRIAEATKRPFKKVIRYVNNGL